MNDIACSNGHRNPPSFAPRLLFACALLLFIFASQSTTSTQLLQPVSASIASYIDVLADGDTCRDASGAFVDSQGLIFVTCSATDESSATVLLINPLTSNAQGLPQVTMIANGTQCATATAVVRHPTTRVVYAACSLGVIALTLSPTTNPSGQVVVESITTVVDAIDCVFPTDLAISESGRFLVTTCQQVVLRIDLNDTSHFASVFDYDCSHAITYVEDSHEFITAACDVSGFVRKDLTTGEIETLRPEVACRVSSSVSRNSVTGTLFLSCRDIGVFQLQRGTMNATIMASHTQCPFAQLVYHDTPTNITYALCADGDVLGITSDSIVRVVAHSSCNSPSSIAVMEDAVILTCFSNGVIRASGSTISTALSYSDCQSPSHVAIDKLSGAIISICNSGLISVKDSVIVRYTPNGECGMPYDVVQDPTTGMIYAACGMNGLVSINSTSGALSTVIDAKTSICSDLQGVILDPLAKLLYVSCNGDQWTGLGQYNLSNQDFSIFSRLSESCAIGNGMDVIPSTNTIVLACFAGGVQTFSQTRNASFAVDCQATSVIVVGELIFAGCLLSAYPVIMINDSQVVSLSSTEMCGDGHGITFTAGTNTLLVACQGGAASVISINLNTFAINIVVSAAVCQDGRMAIQHPVTQTLAIACRSEGVLFATTQFRCTSGTAWQTGNCELCMAQTYRSLASSTKQMSQCQPCPNGFVAPVAGSASCSPCPSGSYDVKKTCFLCPSGKYQPSSSGTTSCIDCAIGTYAIFPGSSVCSLCDPGFYAATNGSVSCTPCDRGSASSAIGLTHACDGCAPGSYQNGVGKTSCIDCEPHSYAEKGNSTSCTRCSSQVNVDRTTCTIVNCDPNSEFNEATNQCQLCPLSQYSSRGGLCTLCPASTYTPAVGSGCAPCDNIEGLECFGGVASIAAGYWAYLPDEATWSSNPGVASSYPLYKTAPCQFCEGSLLQLDTAHANVTIQYCAYPRLNSANNTLCSQCEPGYLAWGDQCLVCNSVNGGLAFGYLVFSFALVIFLLTSSSSASSAASTSILLFFIQTASLEMGPIVKFLDWIQIIGNLDPKSAGTCLAPWSAYDQTLFALLIPLILIGELVVIGVIHYSLHRWLFMSPTSSQQDSSSKPTAWYGTLIDRLRRFSLNDYRIGVISILLFCYTQVSTACMRYLNCIEVGSDRLNFSAPTMDCRSGEYKRYLVAVLIALIGYIIGFPVMAFIALWRHRESLYLPSESDALRSSPSIASFMLHWAGFWKMYHPRAWFWQCWVLLRRAAFVVASVLLIQQASKRFMTFNFLHFTSLLMHQYVRPYEDNRLNYIETISYALLICISQLLMGFNPPYPVSVQAVLFVLIVPSAVVMVGFIVGQRWRQWRDGRSKSMAAAFESAVEPEIASAASNGNEAPQVPRHSDTAIEMHTVAVGGTTSSDAHAMAESILPAYALDSEQQQL